MSVPSNFYPIAVWWSSLADIPKWVTQFGVNVFIWDTAIHGMAGDWEKAHEAIEALRQQGHQVYVIRHPAYLLGPDKLDVTFDQKWRSHILAFNLDDEFEDKQGGNVYGQPQPIIDYVKRTVGAYKAWMPGVPIWANFNGSHVTEGLQAVYQQIVAAGIEMLCSDNYPICNQQHDASGKLLFPDPVGTMVNGTRLFKQWFPTLPCWTFLECCNQDLHKANDPGWATGWTFVGSRAPTSLELWQCDYFIDQYKGDGIAWFPQAHGGAIINGTDPSLVATMQQIAQHEQPPAKRLVATIRVYDDGSVETVAA